MLTPEAIACAKASVLCWLATVDANGQPNVSPKELFAPFDQCHLVIANIASPTTVRNLAHSERVCLSFIDVFVQKGYKVLGSARNIASNAPDFAHWAAPLLPLAGTRFKIHSVIVVRVDALEPIVAPSYRLYPDTTTEASQIASAMQTYGVMPTC
jgi:uncharacterized protein